MSELAPWTFDVLAWIATYTIHSTLLIIGVLAINRLWTGLSPVARDLLWKVALVGPIATASLQLGVGFDGFGGRVPLTRAPVVESMPALAAPSASLETSRQLIVAEAGSLTVLSMSPALPEVAFEAAPAVAAPTDGGGEGLSPTLAAVALGLLGLGSAAALVLFARRVRRLRRHLSGRRAVVEDPALELFLELRSGIPGGDKMRLTTTAAISSPVALLRREVCVPERVLDDGAIPDGELRAMLAHELGHLVRRDPEWLAAASLLEALLFFQPLLRVVRRRMADNAELLCDAWARERVGGGLDLAKCIERVAGWIDAEPLPLASAMARPSSPVLERVRRLVRPADRRRLSAPQRVGIGVGVLALLAWGAPGVSAAEAAVSPAEEDTDEVIGLRSLCPQGPAGAGCSSWHAAVAGEPFDGSWETFATDAEFGRPFAASFVADTSGRGFRKARRRAERDARRAEREEAKRDRERERLAAEIREAEGEARRAQARARRLEAEARELEAEHRVDRLRPRVAHHVPQGERCDQAAAPQVVHVPRRGASDVVIEIDVDDLASLENLEQLKHLKGLEELKHLEIDLDGLAVALDGELPKKMEIDAREFERMARELEREGRRRAAQVERQARELERQAHRQARDLERELGREVLREVERELEKIDFPEKEEVLREIGRERAKIERKAAAKEREKAAKEREKARKARDKARDKANKAREKANKDKSKEKRARRGILGDEETLVFRSGD
jgi:beta-lactamase regulating signal transducer with metallopeptidase domain